MNKALILVATIVAALGIGIGTADAKTSTPNGYCGALNMVQAWPGGGANVPELGGMQQAMAVDNTNGNTGMDTAVGNSCPPPL